MDTDNVIELSVEVAYAAYAPRLVRHLQRLTGNHATAEDLMHDTFVKALRHWDHVSTVTSVYAWLARIATNTAYDMFRRRSQRDTTPLTEAHAATLVAPSAAFPVEDGELLWLALDQLPAYYRAPLLLHGYAGYSIRDIAALTGCKEGTVKSRLKRGRALFRRHYESEQLLATVPMAEPHLGSHA